LFRVCGGRTETEHFAFLNFSRDVDHYFVNAVVVANWSRAG
jgi:hypothetical protein